jgi:hypothetical protein
MVKPWKLIAQNTKGAFPVGEFVNLQDAQARQRFAEKAMPQLNFWVMFEYPENYPMVQRRLNLNDKETLRLGCGHRVPVQSTQT